VRCIVCERTLDAVHPASPHQPYDGIVCYSGGNYGSTIFDPIGVDYEEVMFWLCDDCLTKGLASGQVVKRTA
jgi:hypothetical protein